MGEQRYTDSQGGVYIFSSPYPSEKDPSAMVVRITYDKPGDHSSMVIREDKVEEYKRRKGLV